MIHIIALFLDLTILPTIFLSAEEKFWIKREKDNIKLIFKMFFSWPSRLVRQIAPVG